MVKIVLFLNSFFFAEHSIGQIISTVKIADNVYVTAEIDEFKLAEHSIDTCAEGIGNKYICRIDGKMWFGGGQELDIPRNKFYKLKLSYGNTHLRLDISDMYNSSYEGLIYKDQFKWRSEGNIYFLNAAFSDGAAAYSVQWRIEKGKSVRTYIESDMAEFFIDIE